MKIFPSTEIFEQNPYATLPTKAMHIITKISKRHRAYSGSDERTRINQRQIAEAILYMSLYQEFGAKCYGFMTDATKLLDSLLEQDPLPMRLKHQPSGL
ncbi:MAG TPA: hypothetical protein VGE34_03635 [Candidatus Saccharimonadales bacterium]